MDGFSFVRYTILFTIFFLACWFSAFETWYNACFQIFSRNMHIAKNKVSNGKGCIPIHNRFRISNRKILYTPQKIKYGSARKME